MPSMLYEGPVRISTTNKDGKALIIGKGKRLGQPFCKVSFKVDEQWINTVDFSNEAAAYDGQVCKVAYSQQVDDFGDPVLYNDKPQWNLDAIKPVGGAPATQSANAATPAAQNGDGRQESIQRQTAAKCAAEVVAGLGTVVVTDLVGAFDIMFDHILARIEGKPVEAEEPASTEDDDVPF